MERRSAKVSEAQWSILLDFLEHNPNLARARGYNNSARGRTESLRLWQEVTNILNAEGSGTTKTPKDWSVYVSNYKSKLKKIVANINTDISGTGGGPSRGSLLSNQDQRFLAIMGPGFGQTAPRVSINPFPDMDIQLPSTSHIPPTFEDPEIEEVIQFEDTNTHLNITDRSRSPLIFEEPVVATPAASHTQGRAASPTQDRAASPTHNRVATPLLPRQVRRTRYRSRPLGPLEEARRILAQVETQRAAAEAANARALELIGQNILLTGQNIGRLVDVLERYLSQCLR